MTNAFCVKVIQIDPLLCWLCEEVLNSELATEKSELEMVKKKTVMDEQQSLNCPFL